MNISRRKGRLFRWWPMALLINLFSSLVIAQVPEIARVSPSAGSIGGVITITGGNFVEGATVRFGDEEALSTTFSSTSRIRATPPPPPSFPSTVDVTVTNPDGQSATLAQAFTYKDGDRLENHTLSSEQLEAAGFNLVNPFTVYLPEGYDSATSGFPVVYLLHGNGGSQSHFLGNPTSAPSSVRNLLAEGQIQPLILVMPKLDKNDANRRTVAHEAYLAQELVPYIDAHFRTLPTREGRAIAGWSRGGADALFTALAHPDLFSMVGTYTTGFYRNMPTIDLLAHNPQFRYPLRFWTYLGTNDTRNVSLNRTFDALLGQLHLPHIYVEDGGNHSSRVGINVKESLIFFSQHLGQQPPAQPTLRSATDAFDTKVGNTDAVQAVEVIFDAPLPAQTLSLDLTALGQPEPLALAHDGKGGYTAQLQLGTLANNGLYWLPLFGTTSDQATELLFTVSLAVFPASDRVVFDRAVAPTWTLDANSRITPTPALFDGQEALALESTSSWRITFTPETPVTLFGYKTLTFNFHPAAFSLREGRDVRLSATLTGQGIDLLPFIDLDQQTWQPIVIPLTTTEREADELLDLRFFGNLEGTFYLDDIRLVREEAQISDTGTAVLEDYQRTEPDAFSLNQNYPNPFNSGTVIRFALPKNQDVELAIYNLTGQKVVQLVDGFRAAGQYSINWDGRDAADRPLASGLYLYRLQAGTKVETRKLLLLR